MESLHRLRERWCWRQLHESRRSTFTGTVRRRPSLAQPQVHGLMRAPFECPAIPIGIKIA
jgi:hypothetical protein